MMDTAHSDHHSLVLGSCASASSAVRLRDACHWVSVFSFEGYGCQLLSSYQIVDCDVMHLFSERGNDPKLLGVLPLEAYLLAQISKATECTQK